MTAYGAVISLQNTIDYILQFTLVEPSLEIIEAAYKELQPWHEILERLDSSSPSRSRKKVNAVDTRIKDLIWEFEDLLESFLSKQILSQPQSQLQVEVDEREESNDWWGHKILMLVAVLCGRKQDSTNIDLQPLRDDVGSFIHALKDMEKEYIYELENMDEDDEAISSTVGLGGSKSKMIGLRDQFQQLKEDVMRGCYWRHVHALFGMAGVGKTTLAHQIYQDPQILTHFECRAWVTVGRNPQLDQLSQAILAQLLGITEKIGGYLNKRLTGKKCLIVLDDVWEPQVFDALMSSIPQIKNGLIEILVTARDRNVCEKTTFEFYARSNVLVRFLNEEESKNLLCEKVFGEETCPPQLEKAVIKIAKKCEGLPLMILTVAHLLSEAGNIDPDYWNDVAQDKNSIFKDAYNKITEVLFPSYDYLPQYLKMPFLSLGVFPLHYEIPRSKIINMLSVEAWFRDKVSKPNSLQVSIWDELCTDYFLVLFNMKSILWHRMISGGKIKSGRLHSSNGVIGGSMIKTCWLHSSWRHVCRGEARKNKFYHVLNKLDDAFDEGLRCLCLENNILFGIKEFCNSVRMNSASSARSLLFFGPYHQYPTSIDVGFRLLTKLDALNLRFYSFPTDILTLILLKYLALTCNGELPTSISKLFNLRVLIIHPHMNIRTSRAPPYVPIQIWDMIELHHIEVLGKSFRAPNHVASLEKLSTLMGVNANISTILELSKRISNIRKLGVQIELTPYDNDDDLLSCFRCISTLESLETLKYSVINPVVNYVPATPSPLTLPSGLQKLHLSGTGFPWEYMNVVGSLPFLKVLKLRSYACGGSRWEAKSKSFLRLKFLLIEDNDLVQWIPRYGSFPMLTYLSMKHCYKLEEIHWPSWFKSMDQKIELVDCNPLALTCAKQLQLCQLTSLRIVASTSIYEKPMSIMLERYGDYVPMSESGKDTDEDEDSGDEKEDDADENRLENDEDLDLSSWPQDDEGEISEVFNRMVQGVMRMYQHLNE